MELMCYRYCECTFLNKLPRNYTRPSYSFNLDILLSIFSQRGKENRGYVPLYQVSRVEREYKPNFYFYRLFKILNFLVMNRPSCDVLCFPLWVFFLFLSSSISISISRTYQGLLNKELVFSPIETQLNCAFFFLAYYYSVGNFIQSAQANYTTK